MARLIANVWAAGQGWGPYWGNADSVPAEVAAELDDPAVWADGQRPSRPAAVVPPASIAVGTAEAIVDAANDLTAAVLLDQLAQLPDDKPGLAGFAETHAIEVDNRLGAARMRSAIADTLTARLAEPTP